jgi:RNA polymerase sigma-70 factor (ECF subfamily)
MACQQAPLTRVTLIGALCQGVRWEEFVALYGRLIVFWGSRDFGLQMSDAENLCQEVLIRVWRHIATYDPSKGRFRQWLYACTRNAFLNLRRTDSRQPARSDLGEARLQAVNQDSSTSIMGLVTEQDRCFDTAIERLEEEGFASEGLQRAVFSVRDRVQPNTWKAFLLFELFEMTAKEIAVLLDMRPTAVNQAVFRVRQLLQACLPEPARRQSLYKESVQ